MFRKKVTHTKGRDISHAKLLPMIQEVLKRGSSFTFKAQGHSMYPVIKDGDHVTLSPIKEDDYQMGSIVCFQNPVTRSLSIHRIVGIADNRFLIQGDNLVEPDGFFNAEELFGVVTAIKPPEKESLLKKIMKKLGVK